jgi:ribosome-binding protein aMBF1 (putative translation factor)
LESSPSSRSKRGSKKLDSNASAYLYRRYIAGDTERELAYEEQVVNAEIARKIYDLRSKAGLSQRDLAKKVGTSASAICRLEDADYEGHSLLMLKRIAEALQKRVEIRFVPAKKLRAA